MISKTLASGFYGVLFIVFCVPAQAQQPGKIPRVGYIQAPPTAALATRTEAFRQGLRELGYVEGKNIVIEYRFADGKLDRMPVLAAELVDLKVNVIVTAGPADTRAAKKATRTIPIVMAQDSDPIGNGFVASLARPGGNLTGLATQSPEVSGKQLELLKEIVPKLSRVAIMSSSNIPGNAQAVKEADGAAAALGLNLLHLDIIQPKDIENAFKAVKEGRAEAILVLGNAVLNARRAQVTARR
jgi:putative ABC transport system substrate-binding protein